VTVSPERARPEAAPPLAERLRERASAAALRAEQRFSWVSLLFDALERERVAAAGLLAGGLAYRLFFWLVPLGLVFASVLGFWVESDRPGLEGAAQDWGIGGAAARSAAAAIEEGSHSRWYFLLVGAPLALWFGIGVVRAVDVAHAVAWRLRPRKLQRPLRAGAVFNGLMLGLIGLSVATGFVRELQPELGLLATISLIGLFAAVMTWSSTKLPSRTRERRDFVPGAVLVALGMGGVQLLVTFYLAPKLGRSTELYGALGAATVVLLWLYLGARLIVGGAFLNAALWARRHPEEAREGSSRRGEDAPGGARDDDGVPRPKET
jgi:uncharacterized BrkB/YihY/UPF0761 family membrane protein